MLAGFTGIVPRAVGSPTGDEFPDRAGLIEASWERSSPNLGLPFPLTAPRVNWVTIFNTTSAITGCKVVISSVDTAPARQPGIGGPPDLGADTSGTNCGLGGVSAPGTSNLFTTNPCQIGMPLVTAALMSGRFPLVTPSGVVGGTVNGEDCGPRDQLIDGGYAENSGIGTLDDVLPQIMPLIRSQNAAQLTMAEPHITVPVVMSVENTPRPPPAVGNPDRRVSEPLVPISGVSRKGSQLISTDALIESFINESEDYLACRPLADPPPTSASRLPDRWTTQPSSDTSKLRPAARPRSLPPSVGCCRPRAS